MQIAVVSDSHGRHHTVEDVLRLLKDRGIRTVLHCGDIDDAETVRLFAGFDAHFVYGNCDIDRHSIQEAAAEAGATLHGAWGYLEREGVKIAFLHGNDQRQMHDLEQSGAFDFLFYGHTHVAAEHRTGPTRVVNPGALHRARPKSFVVLDLAGRELESVVVG
jgi:putative phosphoesterase